MDKRNIRAQAGHPAHETPSSRAQFNEAKSVYQRMTLEEETNYDRECQNTIEGRKLCLG